MAGPHSKSESPQAVVSLEAPDRPPFSPRAEIGASWHRSARSGLSPEKFEIPFHPDFDADGPLVAAARPVLNELSNELALSDVGVVLANDSGEVLDRRAPEASLRRRLDAIMLAPGAVYAENSVGTNAIGTALEQGEHSVVEGLEHFAEKLTSMTCAAHPITDPRTGRVLGVVDLSCAAHHGSPLMSPLVRRAASDIERRLLADIAHTDRVLLTVLARESTVGTDPLVLLSEQTMVTNAAAQEILDLDDEVALRDQIVSGWRESGSFAEIHLKNGTFNVLSYEPVIDGGTVIGTSVRLAPRYVMPDSDSTASRGTQPKFGWESLTDTELRVTRYVCQGLTNRAVAECMSISPYTVDSHLRSIFRKLGVNSRVELTRVVLAHEHGRPIPQLTGLPAAER
jgi:DNA-binding CsgD family transcriptional regulator